MLRRMLRGAGLTALAVTVAWGGSEHVGFDPATPVETPDAQWDVILADVDGDGNLDAVTSSRSQAQAQILYGDGDLGFEEAEPVTITNTTVAMNAADLNGDGADDVIFSHSPPGGLPDVDPDELTLLLTDGDGGYAFSTIRFAGRGASAVGIADVDGDTHLDIVGSDDQRSWIALGDGAGNFERPDPLVDEFGWIPANATGVQAADLDGDDDLDLAFATAGGAVITHRNQGDLRFESWRNLAAGERSGFQGPFAYGLKAHDLDGDGDIDLATYNALGLAVFLNEGDGSFAERVDYSVEGGTPGNLGSLAAADFDGDGVLDFALAGGSLTRLTVLRGRGDGTFERATKFDSAEDPRDREPKRTPVPWALDAGLVDGDALADIVSVDLLNDILSVHRASAAAPPVVDELIPPRVLAGQTLDLTFVGADFDPDATVELGPGIALGLVRVISPNQISATITVPTILPEGTPTGDREVSVIHPDGKCTLATLEVLAEPEPVVTSIAPPSVVAADTLDLEVNGDLFNASTTLHFGDGVFVNSVILVNETRVLANVTLAAGAATGPRAVAVTNRSTGLSSVLEDAIDIAPPPTIELVDVRGRLVDRGRTGRDSIKLRSPIVFNSFSPDGTFDSRTDDVTLRIGVFEEPTEIVIPAGDPGWRVRRAKHTYRSARGVTPKVKLVIDTERRKLSVKVGKFDLPQTPPQTLFFDLFAGTDRARSFRPVVLGSSGGVLRIR